MSNYYSSSYEPATERLLLISDLVNSHSFAHLEATVVRRAKEDNPSERNYADGVGATGYRRATWTSAKKSALFVEDFTISSQINVDVGSKFRSYGNRVFFKPYLVSGENIGKLSNTFKKISSGYDKIDSRFGSISDDDFVGYLIRVANVLGIEKFLIKRKEFRTRSNITCNLEFKDGYVECDIGSIRHNIEQLKIEFSEKHGLVYSE